MNCVPFIHWSNPFSCLEFSLKDFFIVCISLIGQDFCLLTSLFSAALYLYISPLSPVLFNIYLRPLFEIISNQKLLYHSYADDTQLYFRICNNKDHYLGLEKCLILIENWMTESYLKLNGSKTELLLFPVALTGRGGSYLN